MEKRKKTKTKKNKKQFECHGTFAQEVIVG